MSTGEKSTGRERIRGGRTGREGERTEPESQQHRQQDAGQQRIQGERGGRERTGQRRQLGERKAEVSRNPENRRCKSGANILVYPCKKVVNR